MVTVVSHPPPDGHFTNTIALNQVFSDTFFQVAQSLTPTGLVAAYSFDEGTGSTTADASGKGNTGTIANATWTSEGKYGKALAFNGINALVTIQDSVSLHLRTGMTLEAWVNPSGTSSVFEDVVYKATDNYYLAASSTTSGPPVFWAAPSPSLHQSTTRSPHQSINPPIH
jgi:hypothetical protein